MAEARQNLLTIEVALGAWINRYVDPKALPEGIVEKEKSPNVYFLEIDGSTTPQCILQKMNIPHQELGIMLFLGQRVFLDSQLLLLAKSSSSLSDGSFHTLWLYPQVIGG